jgi:hypothetical protein
VDDSDSRIKRQPHIVSRCSGSEDQIPRDGNGCGRDDAVAAQRGISASVHEENAGVRLGRYRLGENGRNDIRMAAWFKDEAPAKGIGTLPQPCAFVTHRPADGTRQPFDDEPQCLTPDVGIYGFDLIDH